MNTRRFRLIQIHRCRGITRRTIRLFFRYDSTLIKIFSLTPFKLTQLFSLPMKNATLFHRDLHSKKQKSLLKKHLSLYSTITIIDNDYPNVLKQIKDPPLVLYAHGNRALLRHNPSLSVIGTRNPSVEASLKTNHIVKPLVKYNWLIVSGMAKGIDSYSHHIALNNNGNTIAVLGGGFEYVYPKENKSLFDEIVNNGLVLSEYPPHVRPERYHFPERNRIISGLTFGTLVIEAQEKSGTLITVNQALDQGREVYAVPGSPLVPQTRGCHLMIRDGAKLVLDAEDIIEDWNQYGKNLLNV